MFAVRSPQRRRRPDRAFTPALDGRLEPRAVPADIAWLMGWYNPAQSYIAVTVGGQTSQVQGGNGLYQALMQAQASGQTVDSIFIKGHGGTYAMQLSDTDPSDTIQSIMGHVLIDGQDVTGLLQGVTGPNTQIWLTGCGTGPMALTVSQAIGGGVAVIGNSSSYALGVPSTSISIGMYTAAYRDGQPL
jgi:hypothetical protein